MSLTFKLIYHKRAIKFLEKQESAIQKQIGKGLEGLTIRPPVGDIKPLQGAAGNNLRVKYSRTNSIYFSYR